MEFAVCIGSFDEPERLASELAGEGVTALEAGPKLFAEGGEEEVKRVVRALKKEGIRIFSVHAPFGEEANLSALDGEARRKAVEVHKRVIRNAALAGAEVVIVHPGVRASEEDIPKMEEILPSSLSEVVREAESCGVKIALENMLPDHPGREAESIRRTVELISSPNLGVCFDTGHAHVAGKGELEAFEKLKDLIIAFHLQDNDSTRDMHLQPPYGTIDWKGIVEGIKSMGFESPMTIEAAPWGGVGFGWMLREVEALFKWGLMEVEVDGLPMRVVCPRCGRLVFRDENGWFCMCPRR
ncbi:hypothetical protein DRP77_11750 [Candidatus Poribacteria bacterium]|nr:MAG: hypothetical protein DRP77_11750 [Candidatus Poribacteria bacterium]